MNRPHFTLAVVATLDGFIARTPDHPPQSWASEEEQALFFAAVEAADWAIMGRHTHLAADKPHRRRIIFSTTAKPADWRRPTQLWLDPMGFEPADLAHQVAAVHPLRRGLILGGTRVHDWFHARRAIDCIKLTIEPLHFGEGLPIFTSQTAQDPQAACEVLGYEMVQVRQLNMQGTQLMTLVQRGGNR